MISTFFVILDLILSFFTTFKGEIKVLITGESLESAPEEGRKEVALGCLISLLSIIFVFVLVGIVLQIGIVLFLRTGFGRCLSLGGLKLDQPVVPAIGSAALLLANGALIISVVEYKKTPRDDPEARKNLRWPLIVEVIQAIALNGALLFLVLFFLGFFGFWSGCL